MMLAVIDGVLQADFIAGDEAAEDSSSDKPTFFVTCDPQSVFTATFWSLLGLIGLKLSLFLVRGFFLSEHGGRQEQQ